MDLNFDRIDTRRAEKYRLAAYIFFFLSLAVLLMGLVPAMYYGSGWAVLISLMAAGAFFFLAFFVGGIGWSRFEGRPVATRPAAENDIPMTAADEPSDLPSIHEEQHPHRDMLPPYEPPAPSDQRPPP